MQNVASGFRDIDRADDPTVLVRYLDTVSALQAVADYKRLSFSLLQLGDGSSVLDAGCGTGDDVRLLAQSVGASGRAVGIDSSETVIAEARRRSEGQPVEFRVCDLRQLDFPDGSFDACRADRVFQHLEEPRLALNEMTRVTRSGGWIVVSDPDWETLIGDSVDRAVTRKITQSITDRHYNGWMGRQLPGIFLQSELRELMVVPVTAWLPTLALASQVFGLEEAAERAQNDGLISSADAARWLEQLAEADRTGRFFSAITGFVVAGRKP